jgi:tetratricopeptide (TPR) repeat protein
MAYILSESPQTLDTAQSMAQRAVNRLIEQDPRQTRIRDTISETLAYIYMKKNLHDNAIEIYEQIVPRNQGNARWRYRYAMALFQKGDMPKARDELQRALATNPPKREADQIRQLLSQTGS